MNIAIISNVSATSLAMLLNRSTGKDIYHPDASGKWLQEITNPESGLYQNWGRLVFILLHGPSLFGKTMPESESEASAILTPMVESIAHSAARREHMTFVVSTLDIPNSGIRPLVSHRPEASIAAFWRRSLEERGMPILELSEIAANVGRERFYNRRIWYMGAMPFSQIGEKALAVEMERIWRAVMGWRKKCIALDLDNTLWGGVLGEVGMDGIHLDKTGSGSRFYDFQRLLLDLKRSGVQLSIISKNNPEDALRAINRHPHMLLRESDFAAIRANWEQKSKNLESIAEQLDIDTGSFVFIDDNPIERERMRIAHPEVEAPDFPEDTSQLVPFINDIAREFFLQLKKTDSDSAKTGQYNAESGHTAKKSAFASVDDYLAYLEMVLGVEPVDEYDIARVAQLTQKTNQFNLTTRRRTEAEVRAISNSPGSLTLIGSLVDRFGNYGKIAFCIAHISGDSAYIDTFLMSDRVMGRRVEATFLRAVEDELASCGVKTVRAEFISSGKNDVVARFWEEMGYQETARDEKTKAYRLTLPRTEKPDDIIRLRRGE